MRRRLTFVTALVDTLFTVAIGFGVTLVPATTVWLIENDPSIEWLVAFRVAGSAWLLAQGAPIEVAAGKLATLEIPTFTIDLLPLGYTALLAFLAYRIGRRFSIVPQLWPAWLAAMLGFGAVVAVVASTLGLGTSLTAHALPIAFFAFWLFLGSMLGVTAAGKMLDLPPAIERERVRAWWSARWQRTGWVVRVVAPPAMRAATAFTLIMLGVAASLVGISIALNWIPVINFYEALRVSVLGGVVVTLGQVALLPNLVIYAASWLIGPGFSIGEGSHFGLYGSAAGPLPNLPVLAALPPGQPAGAVFFIAIPLLAAAACTIAVRRHAAALRFEFAGHLWASLSLGLGIALIAAAQFTLLGALATGGLGPGRLSQIGVDALALGGWVFAEVAVVSVLAGVFVTRPQSAARLTQR